MVVQDQNISPRDSLTRTSRPSPATSWCRSDISSSHQSRISRSPTAHHLVSSTNWNLSSFESISLLLLARQKYARMVDNSDYHICLGIPIPRSVQALPYTPPACFYNLGDLSSLQALKDFGKEFNVPRGEISQACNLAAGLADIVVILQRPKTRTSHDHGLPFPQFVSRIHCPTLWAVDELIRFAINGARSIHTVTVLDAFSFKPNNTSYILDERCH